MLYCERVWPQTPLTTAGGFDDKKKTEADQKGHLEPVLSDRGWKLPPPHPLFFQIKSNLSNIIWKNFGIITFLSIFLNYIRKFSTLYWFFFDKIV